MVTTLQKISINTERLKSDFTELSEIGATMGGGVSRLALSNEDLEARAWFAGRIEEAGLLLRDDEVGNLSAVLSSRNPHARTLVTGSHLDTVPNGGQYDGTVGVLAALECLRTIKEAGLELPVHLEAVNFTDEEGSWQSFFGSLGFTGALKPEHVSDAEQDNAAFRVALFRAGIRPDEVYKAKRDPASLLGYVELHIEQSDKLERAEKQIGIVTHIVGRAMYHFDFHGEAVHAATTSREKQHDALQGAALFITRMHQLIQDEYPEGVVNCGSVSVQPGAFSVVPAQASLRVECRHHDEDLLTEMEERLIQLAEQCSQEKRLKLSKRRVLRRSVAQMSPDMMTVIGEVCSEQERSRMNVISYAGHDAQILSKITPSAMIFIPSVNGISHNPKEFTHWEDVTAGANVLLHTLLHLAQQE